MKQGVQNPRVRKAVVGYVIGAVSLTALLILFHEGRRAPIAAWLVLPGMALLAEFLPVEIQRRGVRITFTLPYIAGMAAALSPLAALGTDLAVTLLGALVISHRSKLRPAPFWLAANLAVAAISAGLAGLILNGILSTMEPQTGVATVAALAYAIVYSLANFGLVTYLDSLVTRRSVSENVLSSLSLGGIGIALYCLFAAAVAVLVFKEYYWLVIVTLLPIGVLRHILMLKATLYEHYYETITALTLMLQRAHPYTHGHLERVARISEEVAMRLGLPAARARLVREAAVLHDIGKIAIDEAILDKPAKLDDDEMTHVRQHPVFGARILSNVAPFRDIVDWVRFHHERPDGGGYPDGLYEPEIPIESKIIAVVDAYDAMTGGEMTARRPYRDPVSTEEALLELERHSGTQFDRRVVRAFREIVLGGPV